MLGAIIGDIVGSRFEFHNIKTKEFKFFDKKCHITDDSIMSVAVAEMCCKGYVPNSQENIIKTFKKWGQKYPNAGYGGNFISWVLSNESKPYNSYGNGAAMRISAIGHFAKTKEEVKKFSDAVTKVTHNHPEGLKGAYVTAMCIFMARKGETKAEIKKFVEQYYDLNFDYQNLIETYVHADEICQNTVPEAIFCFLISNGFEDCIRTTISIGGDCDTTAAISGAIAEAYYGIPKKIREEVMEYISDDVKDIVSLFENKIELKNKTIYGDMLKFIRPLEEYPDKLVKWETSPSKKTKNGEILISLGHPEFQEEVVDFLSNFRQFIVRDYDKVIEKAGIQFNNIDILQIPNEKLNEKTIFALITAIIRGERMCEGLLQEMIENGSILKLLVRLKDFDRPLKMEETILELKYTYWSYGDLKNNEGFSLNLKNRNRIEVEVSSFDPKAKHNGFVRLNSEDSKTLIEKMTALHVLEWKNKYMLEDLFVMDADSWHLEIKTYNLEEVSKAGYIAFPRNWRDFIKFKNWIFERVK